MLFLIKGYADTERQLKAKEKVISAENIEEAWNIAREEYCEHKEIGVYVVKGEQ